MDKELNLGLPILLPSTISIPPSTLLSTISIPSPIQALLPSNIEYYFDNVCSGSRPSKPKTKKILNK